MLLYQHWKVHVCAGQLLFSLASCLQHHPMVPHGTCISSNVCFPPARSPVRSPAAGATFHRSTEDLRMRQSASYGRLRKLGRVAGRRKRS